MGEQPREDDLLEPTRYRFTDRQALWLLGGYLLFRAITQRFGLGAAPSLKDSAPWAIPLLNNSTIPMVIAGSGVYDEPALRIAVAAASLLLSLVAGLILYWAGWRFGPRLAEMAKGSPVWSGIWNPKQIDRAHRWIERWGFYAILLARGAVEFMIVPVALVAGLSRMSFRKYVAAFATGAVIFAGLTLWLGQQAATRWPGVIDWLESAARWFLWGGIGLVVLFVLLFVVAQRLEARDGSGDPPTDAA